MKINKKIDWIFFDVGGVIRDDTEREKHRRKMVSEIAAEYGVKISPKEVDNLHIKASAMQDSIDRNLFLLILEDKKLAYEAAEKIVELRKKQLDPYKNHPIKPGTKVVVEALSKKYKLGVIANQPKITKGRFEHEGIAQFFQLYDMSEHHGMYKPQLKYFNFILGLTKADPNSSAFVDDNIERGLVPAKKLGMTTVWYEGINKGSAKEAVDYTIHSLDELLDIFL